MHIVLIITNWINRFLETAARFRCYTLLGVNPVTGGWIYYDSAYKQHCLVQSGLADYGTPIEIDETEASSLLQSEALDWVPVQPGITWFADLDRLDRYAREELIRNGHISAKTQVIA